VRSEAASAPALKAAFLYNFARFAEWPADSLPSSNQLNLCVIGDQGVSDALEVIIKGRAAEARALTVQPVKADGPLRSCHLLYVSGLDDNRIERLLEILKGAPVLTVGENQRFAQSGGVAQLIVENDRMRFAINVRAARSARLQLSSRLLSLATIIN
jgi:hypothetical protein